MPAHIRAAEVNLLFTGLVSNNSTNLTFLQGKFALPNFSLQRGVRTTGKNLGSSDHIRARLPNWATIGRRDSWQRANRIAGSSTVTQPTVTPFRPSIWDTFESTVRIEARIKSLVRRIQFLFYNVICDTLPVREAVPRGSGSVESSTTRAHPFRPSRHRTQFSLKATTWRILTKELSCQP